jgi:hypothetical protein
MRWFRRALPAAAQPPTGIHRDDDFRPPDPGVAERFVGYWRGHPVYRERAPRPIWIRSERAIANERAAAERRAARGEVETSFDDAPRPYAWDGRGQPD